MRCSVYIATSVDGRIAGPNGELDWLDEPEVIEGEDYGYYRYMDDVDCLVMGRNSFETVMGMDVDWPYEVPVIVVSTTGVEIPDQLADRIRHESLPPDELVAKLEAEGYQHAWIDGGDTIRRFLRDGLIERMTITMIPVVLGGGPSLLDGLDMHVPLQLEHNQHWPNGMAQATYRVS